MLSKNMCLCPGRSVCVSVKDTNRREKKRKPMIYWPQVLRDWSPFEVVAF